ncbi:MAG TPA: hypothetical protein VGL86_22985 [Polyangia bacterium]|jgi:hypothetical protein
MNANDDKKDDRDAIEVEALTDDALDVAELDRRLELALAGGLATWGGWCPKEAAKVL